MAKVKERPPKVYNEAEKILIKYGCTYARKSKDPFIIVTGLFNFRTIK